YVVVRYCNKLSRWCKKDGSGGRRPIETKSSRPNHHPKALKRELVSEIIKQRQKNKRCAEVVHQELLRREIVVSLSSVKRTLDRCYLTKKRSPWKRPHDFTPRPGVEKQGDLVQIDTIHIMGPDNRRIYVYTLVDLYSRWAYAKVVSRISAVRSVRFVQEAQREASFSFAMIQSDHGPEFSARFTHDLNRMKTEHRHSRVRKPNDNAHVERFNRTIQEECLDRVPRKIFKFRKALENYLIYYNTERLHMGINYQTPLEVLQRS
ncbi:integrase core domain-containing protein, partial [Thermodesulfobacteriota bacterium]